MFGRILKIAIALLVVGGLGWGVYTNWPTQKAPPGGRSAARGAGGGGGIPVPVSIVAAANKDVPIYLDGLGTVQAFNSVTMRARVDGELIKVAFSEGQDVKAGDVLAIIDPRPYQASLAQAEAKKAQDEALLANARVDMNRYANLKKEGNYVTGQQYDTQRAQVAQYEAAVKSDQAAIDNAKVQLGYTTITSPIDGRIGLRLVDQGNIVHAGDSTGLVVVNQLKPISLLFTLPDQALGPVKATAAAEGLTVIALDRDNKGEIARGKLTVVDNLVDQTTGTVKLKATFDNDGLKLWPGQFVNARLLVTTRKNALVVPTPVIQRGPKGAYAYVVKPDQTVEMRMLKIGPVEDDVSIIEDGLTAGEQVVLEGQYRLQPGSRIQARTAPVAGDPGATTPIAPADGQAPAAQGQRRQGQNGGPPNGNRQGQGQGQGERNQNGERPPRPAQPAQ